MISNIYEAIFIHVPKCAGQSIEHLFLKEHGLSWNERREIGLGQNTDPRLGPPRLAHMTLSEYLDLGYLTPDEYRKYFKFAFVRNPWARLVSEYNYRNYHYLYDFKTFVLRKFPRKGWSDEYRHVMPQWEYLIGPAGDLGVDFIGRFESLQKDFDKVASQLSLADGVLPRVNAGGEKKEPFISRSRIYQILGYCRGRGRGQTYSDYRDYYDSDTDDFVRNFYKKDIELFDYDF